MNRRHFLQATAAAGAGAALPAALAGAVADAGSEPRWHDASVAELRLALDERRVNAAALADHFLRRIEQLDRSGPALRSVIETNPDAPALARVTDESRGRDNARGPLAGIPVLVKDNLDTHDRMMTTAGSLALLGAVAPQDSTVVKKLREAGAVPLGKTNLSEWANFRANNSTSGWSARGGLTKNPYALDRNPSGSSAGSAVAVAAGFCAVAVGTETNGSILSPSTVCGIVGLKPTVGLVSRAGIIPISSSQDTAGPMARTVRDAAILLGAIAGPDDRDPATRDAAEKGQKDYTQFLAADGLKSTRIGVPRNLFRGNGRAMKVIEEALTALKDGGAELVDPIDFPPGVGGASYEVMLYEFKAGINAYLATLDGRIPVRTLADLIEFNKQNAEKEMPYFGQEIFLAAQEKGPLTDKAYLDAAEKCRRLSRAEGIDKVMDQHRLDALVAPSGGPAGKTDLVYGDRDVGGSSTPAAVAGYPNLTVPAGHVRGLPVGISFFGRAWSEQVLLRIAYAFEQLTKARKAPEFLPSVG
jgi:amidase